jgi:hypothetical protein
MKEIRSRLSIDLRNAMKEKDSLAVNAIRSLMSAIDNAGAVPVEKPEVMPISGGIAGATEGLGSSEALRKELSDGEIKQIIQKEIDEMAKAVELINDSSYPESKERIEQINILKTYL